MTSPSRILPVGVLLTLACQLAAQNGTIRGVVSDADYDVPLAGATVQVVETGSRVQSLAQGDYSIADLPPGRYTVIFSKDGYVRQLRSDVVVSAGRLTDLDIALAADIAELEEYVVQDVLQFKAGTEAALLQMRFESPSLVDSVGSEFMSRAGASDAADAIRLVAGATVQDGKSAVIRGLPDRYVSSQMNGVRLPSAQEDKRAVELDQFPSVVIQDIRVSKTFTPDQQGDASGGAVDVRLRGVPEDPFYFDWKFQVGHNDQVAGRGDFLTYKGGGLSYWGRGTGRRGIQDGNIGSNWGGAVGVTTGEAPIDYKWSTSIGASHELDSGVRIGGFASFFYERDSSFYKDGIDDSWWVTSPGNPMTPRTSQGTILDEDFKTSLFDITKGSQSVQLGSLVTFGVESEEHNVTLAWLSTRTAEDTATVAEDTRGKEYFFPGYDPADPTTPGHSQPDAAPYLRLETLQYTERTAGTLQLAGQHRSRRSSFGLFEDAELGWTISRSTARSNQPDKRQFGALWRPGRTVGPITIPDQWFAFKPSANFTLGNLQRIYKRIAEDSEQYSVDLKLPFEQWSGEEGYLKFGWFRDDVDRRFDQETFSNFGDNSSFNGPFEQSWSEVFPYENHPITGSDFDVDYEGDQRIMAYYGMLELPLSTELDLVGGVRFESTDISIVNEPESLATWYPPGSIAPTALTPGAGDVAFSQHDALPAVSLIYRPLTDLTVRLAYSETVARQTFKELSPILQQEYLGGPVFIGNPDLGMSSLRNYDLRADYVPYEGGLLSVSWFKKDLRDPIEYVQKLATFDFTTAVNYPKGELEGVELETRHELGRYWDGFDGIGIGANYTMISGKVTLPEDEQLAFQQPNIQAPMSERDMTGAPDHLYNLYLTYDLEETGTRFGVFYTVTGDTLIAGAGESSGNYVPNIYATEFDNLNVSLQQRVGEGVSIRLQAKNLTDPAIREVYRSPYIGDDVTNTSYRRGVDYSISIGGTIRF